MYHIVFEPLSFGNSYILVGDNNVTSKWNEVFFISNIAVSSRTFPFYTPYGNWQTFTARLHDGSGHEGVAVLLPVLLSFDSKTRSWWRHQMETFSTLLAICVGNSPGTGEFQGWGQVKYLYLVLGTWCKISSTWYLLVLDTLKFKSTWYLLVLEGKVLDTCPSTFKYFCQI